VVTVVVVEDDGAVRQVVRDILELDGVKVIGVADADHAVQVARGIRADLFLVDLMLQHRSGVEVAQDLRDVGFHGPLVGMSASPFVAEVARESGLFADIIEKPFEVDDLLLAITEHGPPEANLRT
jgi:DNA-binding response OmpR family regulator